MRSEAWIFSTAARRITLHGHCVSLMCIQNSASTMAMECPAGELPQPGLGRCRTAPRNQREPMTQSASLARLTRS